MTEAFLHFVWKHKLYDATRLQTQDQGPIEVLSTGRHNTDAGPDFFDARLQMGNTLWAGNVELHVNASDWMQHGHQYNAAYDNVILHLVANFDTQVTNSRGEQVLTATLPFRASLQHNYQQLLQSETWVACEASLSTVDSFVLRFWLGKLSIERLERKNADILLLLESNQNNWEETFYQFLARSFGFHINAVPFEQLARSLPVSVLAKNKDNLLALEALFFGQAGFLDQTNAKADPYFEQLKAEYQYQRSKYRLQPMHLSQWKFMRLRPANFPTVRLAQLAALVHCAKHLFARVRESQNIAQLESLFDMQTSSYWDTHYNFFKESKPQAKKLGTSAFHSLVLNAVVPILFAYGKYLGDEQYTNRALAFWEEMKPESNNIVDHWNERGIVPRNTAEAQALIELHSKYCEAKRCLQCAIGNNIIKR